MSGRSWCIGSSYKILVPIFAPVRNNLRLSGTESHVVLDADGAGVACHGAEGAVGVGVGDFVFHVRRVAGCRDYDRWGGCFANGFVASLAQISYKSKNIFAEYKQPLLILAEPPLTIDADHAANDKAEAPEGVGTRGSLVAVGDCECHGETVAEGREWGQ